MGNLGDYQRMTSLAKRVGGPKALGAGLLAAGGALGVGGKKAFLMSKAALARRREPCPTKGLRFRVTSGGEDGQGAKFQAGGEYMVLECDGDAILVEIVGDPNNPYVVSSAYLATVSGYPAASAENDG